MGKKKIIIAVSALVFVAGAGFTYKTVLVKKKPAPPAKIAGQLFTLSPDFVVNLADGHYGKLTVALVMTKAPPAPASGETATLPEDAAVRAIITDQLTGASSSILIDRTQRDELVQTLLKRLKKETDEPITGVLVTDIAVQ
jgi:flagellar basal body-associated protein FliL